jgi:ribosomal protein L24E
LTLYPTKTEKKNKRKTAQKKNPTARRWTKPLPKLKGKQKEK